MKRTLLQLIALSLIAALAITACGGSKADSDEALPEARPLLEEGAQQIQNADSFGLEMDVEGYPVHIELKDIALPSDTPLEFKYARGIFQAPDRVNASIQFAFGVLSTTAELIAVDRDHYFRGEMLGNRWIRGELIDGFSPAALIANPGGIGYALDSIRDLQMVGRTDLDGIDVFHLRGTIQASNVHALTFGLIRTREGTLGIEVFITVANRRVAQIVLSDPPPADEENADPTTWLINFSDYNQPVTITPPPAVEATE